MNRLFAVLALLSLASCSGSKSDIDVTVTVDSATFGRDASGKLNGTITVTVGLGSFATGPHVVTPSSVQAVIGARIFPADLGSSTTYNPNFAPGDSRTATFPISCGTADDCGASVVCAAGGTANVDFLYGDSAAGMPMMAGQIASGSATVSCH